MDANSSWEDIAVEAVERAMRGVADHVEVVGGFRKDADTGAWVECSHAIDEGAQTTRRVVAEVTGADDVEFLMAAEDRAAIRLAARDIAGLPRTKVSLTSQDWEPTAGPRP